MPRAPRIITKAASELREAAAIKRGSQIAEASLVYPVIIVISVMSVAAMAHFYSCAAKAAAMSIDARSTADATARTVKRTGAIYDAISKTNGAPAEDGGDNSDKDYYGTAYGSAAGGRNGYSIEEENGILYGKVKASYTAELSMSGMFSAARRDVYTVQCSALNESQLIWKKQLIGDILGNGDIENGPSDSGAPGCTENE